jgi:hypothetical protein
MWKASGKELFNMIYVLYATKVNIGGWATFTRHLVDSLVAEGQEVKLVKLGNRAEAFTRPFGPNHAYHNITLDELVPAMRNGAKCIIAALGKHYIAEAQHLIACGAKVVIHDTAESTVRMGITNPWCIRKTLAEQFNGTFIRHPYVRHVRNATKRGKAILATSRVDFDKNTGMILDANSLGAKIEITGFENRLYTRFKICPDYPEWEQSKGTHPRTGAESFERLQSALAMVDLTDIKGDGGGTQYTFLEAWDAGAVPIIGRWWLRPKDDMKHLENCIAVESAKDLAMTAREIRKGLTTGYAEAGERRLSRYHAPKIIVPQVLEWLNAS